MKTEEYIKDIEIIKNILIKQRKTPIIEPWAFFIWSSLVFSASTFHYFLILGNINIHSLAVRIWLPVSLVGIISETIGWLKSKQKNFVYLFSETNLSLLFGLICVSIFGILSFYILLSLNGLFLYPFILAGLISLAIGYLGIFISSAFYSVSVVLLSMITTLFFIPIDRTLASYLCGILVSLGMLGAGIINKKILKGKKDVS